MIEKYEAICVFKPVTTEDKIDAFVSKVEKKIAALGAKIEKVQKHGLKRVSTRMRKFKTIRDGIFLEIDFEGPTSAPAEVTSIIRVNEDIMRFIVTKAAPEIPVEKPAEEAVEVNPEMLIGKPE